MTCRQLASECREMTHLPEPNRSDAEADTPDNIRAFDGKDDDISADVSAEVKTVSPVSASQPADVDSSQASDPTGDAVSSIPSLVRKRSILSLRSALAWARPIVPNVVSTLGLDGIGSPNSADADTGETASKDIPRLGPPDTPDLNMVETDDEYQVVAALPGLKASDITLTIEGELLSIDAEHETSITDGATEAHITEITLGRLHRTLELPGPVGKAEAEFSNGLLTVTLVKKPIRPRRIRVKTSQDQKPQT